MAPFERDAKLKTLINDTIANANANMEKPGTYQRWYVMELTAIFTTSGTVGVRKFNVQLRGTHYPVYLIEPFTANENETHYKTWRGTIVVDDNCYVAVYDDNSVDTAGDTVKIVIHYQPFIVDE